MDAKLEFDAYMENIPSGFSLSDNKIGRLKILLLIASVSLTFNFVCLSVCKNAFRGYVGNVDRQTDTQTDNGN
jgi:hypothetical protein